MLIDNNTNLEDIIITIPIQNSNINYWKQKGYIINTKSIDVKSSDLPISSTFKFDCKCDCGVINNITFAGYKKNVIKNREYVCKKCSLENYKNTCVERYGVENPMQNKEIKEKAENTNLEKYGFKHPIQNSDIHNKIKKTMVDRYSVEFYSQNEEYNKKIKNTCLDKYNVEHTSQLQSVKDKVEKTNIEKYGHKITLLNDDVKLKSQDTIFKKFGVLHPMKSSIIIDKIKKNNKNKFSLHYEKIIPETYTLVSYDTNILTLNHKHCENIFTITTGNYFNRLHYKTELCTFCNPIDSQVSGYELQIKSFLSEHNIEFEESNRTILSGKELDIYIPSHNLSIEFNGLYWHSELFKDKYYHLNKTLICQENKIQLLHIFEDDWVYRRDIVKSIILNKISKIDSKLYGRKCEIREVKSKDAINFLDENHIQGSCKSKYKIGLYHNNELVSLMTFGYRRTNAKKEFELIRFCNKINTNVIGASSKLFKYFVNNYKIEEGYLISYSDLSLFDGRMYEMLGFEYKHLSKPNYFWVKDNNKFHRFIFNKQKLIKEGFDPNKTEVEIMHERGYYRIYGCGQVRWEFII